MMTHGATFSAQPRLPQNPRFPGIIHPTAALIRCCLYFCNWLQLAAVACNYSCHTRTHTKVFGPSMPDWMALRRPSVKLILQKYIYINKKRYLPAKVNGGNAMKFEHRLWVRPIDRPNTHSWLQLPRKKR